MSDVTKAIRVTMPDGSEWDVPAIVVAELYADARYARTSDAWALVYRRMLSEAGFDALCTFAESNVDWCDVAPLAVMVRPSDTTDYEDGWTGGEKERVV